MNSRHGMIPKKRGNMSNILEMNLSGPVVKAIQDMGFEEFTPIQEQAIPILMEGKDLIGQSQTGTGKTAAFAIPVLEKVDPVIKRPQVIILCPTRELAVQVANEFNKLTKYMHGVKSVAVYGGEPIYRQIQQLKKGAQIIIGTPGRTIDHINRGTLKTEDIQTMVLDEADEMLKMGFREDIELVLSHIGEERQTILFSATMPQTIIDITKKYQNNPELIKVTNRIVTADTIKQEYCDVHRAHRIEAISRVLEVSGAQRCMVFCNKKSTVNDVADALLLRNFSTDKIHGDLKQEMRMDVLKKFNNAQIQVLVATDVAARGLDIQNVDLVVNYDTPENTDYYVHRIGRSGRAGRDGHAITMISGGMDRRMLQEIERYTKKKITKIQLPTSTEVQASKVSDFIKEVDDLIKEGDMHEYMAILNEIDTVHPIEEICAALIKKVLAFESDEEMAEDINFRYKEDKTRRPERRPDRDDSRSRGSRRGDQDEEGSRKKRANDKDMVRMFLNVGVKDNLKPKNILGAIAGECNIRGNMIGSIDMMDNFTFVDVHKDVAKTVLKKMDGNKINHKKISIEVAKKSIRSKN